MKDTVKAAIADAVRRRNITEVLNIVTHEYEFECPSFVYAGPGHQSKHTCEERYPHDLDGEHSDFAYQWTGTSVINDGKLVFNAWHRGDGRCGH